MSPNSRIDWRLIFNAVKSELDVVAATLRDKGGKRFAVAFALAGLCVALAYFGVYRPPHEKGAGLTREIAKAKAMSSAGAQYKELRDELALVYATLPQMKDREQWLSNAMIDSLRAGSLTPDNFKPTVENEISGLIFQSSTVQLTIKFAEFHAWLTRLEATKPLLHISSLNVRKKPELFGWNDAKCEVMTAIPKKRFN